MPRDLIRAEGHDRTRSLGWLALAWQEHFTVHGPGDVQGERVVLDDEIAEWVVDSYAVDAGGRRLYDSAFISRAKGRDKSGQAARFAMFEAFGPCRFLGFATGGESFEWRDFRYVYEPGEPMGRPIVYPFIRIIATEESQAGNTYDNVYYNLTEGPLATDLPGNAAGITRVILPHGGEIIPSTSANASKDGGKESFVVFDETHLYTLPELKRMYATVRRNMAKRREAEPWSLETSTMYLPGDESVAEETHAVAEAIRAGDLKRERLLFDHREGPPDVDLSDEASLRAALAETYGAFAAVMDLDRIIDEIWDPRNSPSDSRRYFLNQPTGAHDAWITQPEWRARLDVEKVVADQEAITLGFDGSRKRSRKVTDATALVGCRVSDGHLFEVGVWEQPTGPAGDGWSVPTLEVEAAVHSAFQRWRVVGFYADPAKWETFVADWEARYGKRLTRAKATRDHPIEWWMTGGRAHLIVRALEQFHSAVVDGELTHDGSSALTRHVLNARKRPTRSGEQISKEHPDSSRKIDAAVAAVLAWQARLTAIAHGARQGFVPRRIR